MSSFHVLYLYHICTQNSDPTTVQLNLSFRNLPVCRISDPSSKSSCIACSERLTLSRALRNSPLVGSEPVITHFHLSSCHQQIMPPAQLSCAEELLLGTAVSLQHCLLVWAPCVPGVQPRSAAEDVIFSSPLTSPEMSLGLHGQQLLKGNSMVTVLWNLLH